MLRKRHLPVIGGSASGPSLRAPFLQVLLAAFANLVLWLPLGMIGMFVAHRLRGWLPFGTSPAVGLLAIAPLLLSFALASLLAVAWTMHPVKGRRAVGLPLLSGLLAALFAVGLALAAGVLSSLKEAGLIAAVLSAMSVPAALGGHHLGRRFHR